MSVVGIDTLSEKQFLEMSQLWADLLSQSPANEIFLSWEWMHAWWKIHSAPDKALYILLGRNEHGEAIGIAPLYLQTHSFFSLYTRKVMRFCSAADTAPDHLDFICRPEYRDDFVKAFFSYLQETFLDWDVLHLTALAEDSPLLKFLSAHPFPPSRFQAHFGAFSTCPYLPIDRSFQEYLATWPRTRRNLLSRKKKALFRRPSVSHRLVTCPDNPHTELDLLVRLHEERTRTKGRTSPFLRQSSRQFHYCLTAALAPHGKVHFHYLHDGSHPLAAYYCFKHANKYYYYQSGLSRLGLETSAGTVLLSLVVQTAFEQLCGEFDFLRGNEAYKSFWTDKVRTNYEIFIARNTISGRVESARRALRSRFRRILHTVRKPNETASPGKRR